MIGSARAWRAVWKGGLAIACLALPAWAHAQSATGCQLLSGGDSVTFNVPPAVNLSSSNAPISGRILYISHPYEFQYRCTNSSPFPQRVALTVLGDYTPVRQAMRDASLRLDIVNDGDMINMWNPDPEVLGGRLTTTIREPYIGDTGIRSAYIVLILSSTKRVNTPLRVFLPPTSAFKLIADEWAAGSPGIFLNTTASRFQYIPVCVGDVSVDNVVQFDPVLTTVSYNGKLPQSKPFNVITRINQPACAGVDALVKPPSTSNPLDEFLLRLAVSFQLQSGGRIDIDDESLILTNAAGQENGLKLRITNASGQSVKLGPVSLDDHGVPHGYYRNNLAGSLHGSTLSLTQQYTAHLERQPGTVLRTGQYSAQMLVKFHYF